MNKKRFIAKILLLAMLIQYTSQPVLVYADNNSEVSEITETEETEDRPIMKSYSDNKEVQKTNVYKNLDKSTYINAINENEKPDMELTIGRDLKASLYGDILKLKGTIDGNIKEFQINETYKNFKKHVTKIVIEDNLKIKGKTTDSTIVNGVFNNFDKLETIEGLDLIDTSDMTNMLFMFQNCKSLKSLNLSKWNIEKVVSMGYAFSGCTNLVEFKIDGWNTKALNDTSNMFQDVENMKTLNLNQMNMDNVTMMPNMFSGCKSLDDIQINEWKTNQVQSIFGLFLGCTSLKNLNLSNFDTSNASDMGNMFSGCTSLENLNLNSFDTSKVTDMEKMFFNCTSLEELNLSNFDTSKVTKMNDIFGKSNLDTLTLGTKTFLKPEANLPEKTGGIYSGRWKNKGNSETIYESSLDFMTGYNRENPGTYYRETYSLKLKDAEYTIGDTFNIEDVVDEFILDGENGDITKLKYRFSKDFGITDKSGAYTLEVYLNDAIAPEKNKKANIKVKPNKYTVNFNSKGGTLVKAENLEQNDINIPEKLNKPEDPNREGYKFINWCLDEDLQNVYDFNTEVKESFTLYADWEKADYTVKFDTKGGSKVDDKEVKYEEKLDKPENPTKDGYKFINWYLDEDLQNVYDFDTEVKESFTLYADWDKEEYTVKFDTKGGSKVSDKKVKYEEKLDKPEDPTREGYKFINWYLDEDLENVYDFNTDVKESFTLFADWEESETIIPEERISDTVVLASGYKYTDVLTATVLANEKDAPILLSEVDSLTEDTISEIKRINPKEIIISGGENSVSKKVEDLLKAELKDISIIRISGKDRYETAKNIGVKVREISPNKTEAMLVDGTNFPDVITMSTIASKKRAPILLTEPKVLNETTKNSLNEFGIEDIIIGGGFDSVSESIEKDLRINNDITRYGGRNRYETASIVGNEYRALAGISNNLIIVDGTNFPDGITTSSIASKLKAPILLTKPNSLPEYTAKDINIWKSSNTIIAGGENSVNSEIYKEVKGTERISGKDRYETAVKISQKLTEIK